MWFILLLLLLHFVLVLCQAFVKSALQIYVQNPVHAAKHAEKEGKEGWMEKHQRHSAANETNKTHRKK
jgi:hypothetical protein